MKHLTDCYTLNNGTKIPCVGFGTWQTPDGETAVSAVKAALDAGYRHIATAAAYGNEESVGVGIKQSGVAREDIFLTTKLWNGDHGYEATLKACDLSLKKLGTDYLDLYLIHWPNPKAFRDCWEEKNAESWRAMEELAAAGKVRAIGVSNFMIRHMEALLKTAKTVPAANQIKLCPGITQDEVVDYCRQKGILLQAYSPLGTGKIFDIAEMRDLAQKYGKTVAQVCVRWSLQMGFNPLPKSVSADRIAENAGVFDFQISEGDMAVISAVKGLGEAPNPDDRSF